MGVLMAKPDAPLWKKLFDAAESTLGPRLNEFVRSENFAILAGLAARARTELVTRSERSSRQVLHLLNLPAGSDVSRLLAQIGLLEREVRELRKQIDDERSSDSGRPHEGRRVAANGVARQSRVGVDKDPA
jgi:hypothetical protein